MNEELRNEIMQRWQAGTPMKRIARELQVAPTTVRRVLGRIQAERAGEKPATPPRRPSTLTEHEAFIRQLHRPLLVVTQDHHLHVVVQALGGQAPQVREGMNVLAERRREVLALDKAHVRPSPSLPSRNGVGV